MAQLLASLTNHFDMCVTAIRTTEGAAALARRKAAESQGPDGVSISGVIAEHDSDLEPKTAKDRAEMLKVVVQDAGEVDDVVQEIQDRLAEMEIQSAAFSAYKNDSTKASQCIITTYSSLLKITLPDYIAAETDFRQSWKLAQETVFAKLKEMRDLREFYERYAGAYDSLLLEVERRKAVREKVRGIWDKARESVDKLLEADGRAREGFRSDVGEFLPTDLWDVVEEELEGDTDTREGV